MKRLLSTAIMLIGMAACHSALAEETLPEGAANVVCKYSHTLADDPILYPGKPGIAMSHDFFGNEAANGNSTAESLLTKSASTCENVADATAYWAPSLRLADGRIIKPSYQKTYYTNQAVPGENRYKVNPLPNGIQLLAGDHHGSAANSNISFICTGTDYMNDIPTQCKPDPVKGTQFNIGISFPTCWDGKNYAPLVMSGGPNNAAYADKSGTCPAGYPKRIPHISINVAYMLGNVTDLSGAQLSLDPTLDDKGNVVHENWGSLYTAHADFFNGWRPEAAKYMADFCMNNAIDCGKEVAYSYTEALADASVTDGDAHATNFGSDKTLTLQNGGEGYSQTNSYIRFKIPEGASNFPKGFTPVYKLSLHGRAQPEGVSGVGIYIYATSDDWDENKITMDNAPDCSNATLFWMSSTEMYNTYDITPLVQSAIDAGKKTISLCVKDGTDNNFKFDIGSRESDHKPVLSLISYNEFGV